MILSRFLLTIITFELVSAKPFDEGYGIRIAKIDMNPSDLKTRVAGGQEGSSSSGVAGLGWYTFHFSSLQKFVSIQIKFVSIQMKFISIQIASQRIELKLAYISF